MRNRPMAVVGLGDKHLRNALEHALMNGSSLLIENVGEDLDPMLDPVLDQRFVRKVRVVNCTYGGLHGGYVCVQGSFVKCECMCGYE